MDCSTAPRWLLRRGEKRGRMRERERVEESEKEKEKRRKDGRSGEEGKERDGAMPRPLRLAVVLAPLSAFDSRRVAEVGADEAQECSIHTLAGPLNEMAVVVRGEKGFD